MKFNSIHRSRRNFLAGSVKALPFVLFPRAYSWGAPGNAYVHRTAFAMGTTVSIQAYHRDEFLIHTAITKAFGELQLMDSLLSVYNSESEISLVNRHSGLNAVAVSQPTMEIVKSAVKFSEATNGVFDCTVEPLMRLWGFRDPGRGEKIPPSDKEIVRTLESVGFRHIVIDETKRTIGLEKEGSAIDLGGIAVGFTVDRMAAILRSHGIESALINHSGDLFAIGTPPDADGWRVGIPSLRDTSTIVHSLTITNEAISTSASNEKYIVTDGGILSHIIDPNTGIPSAGERGVSVIAATSLQADAASTALFRSPSAISNGTERIGDVKIIWNGQIGTQGESL